ncbi:hypothetical protein DUNSADRAFT_3648 [Dunaliella salina]|uniref:Class I SAM-dependent methyltransferase n=1 Tax=Dunaliella salina TaxID=3046 RepID=A0ABQ7FV95_DUNSA|nr:hypothetical protein DUNSADRAFT_3648 [Dunaliella salina]|eukprot:KAF5826311.1 hypothetical protein DUNSADRAFT_3648 [Dunaliella salina]
MQVARDIFGTIGEIGVHHGWFFAVLASCAKSCESLFACDIFGDGSLNIDRSGNGSLEHFLTNAANAGVNGRINVFDTSSVFLLEQYDLPPIRMLSIDGGHTQTLTYNDLLFASCVLSEGGVVFLDDFMNTGWRGVQRGFSAFLVYHYQGRLIPFSFYHVKLKSLKWPIKTESKLLFTTRGHVTSYQESLLRAFPKSSLVNSSVLRWAFEDRVNGEYIRSKFPLVHIML